MMQERAPNMRKLTVELMGCSDVSRVDGGELDFANFGDVLWKGTSDSRRLNTSQLDSLNGDDLRNTRNLLG
jgi:hypothetical protein